MVPQCIKPLINYETKPLGNCVFYHLTRPYYGLQTFYITFLQTKSWSITKWRSVDKTRSTKVSVSLICLIMVETLHLTNITYV